MWHFLIGTQHTQLSVLNSSPLTPKEWNFLEIWCSVPASLGKAILLLVDLRGPRKCPRCQLSSPPSGEVGSPKSQRHRLCWLAHLSCLSFLTLVCKVTYSLAPRATSGEKRNYGLGLFLCWNTHLCFPGVIHFWNFEGKTKPPPTRCPLFLGFRTAAPRCCWHSTHSTHWDQEGKGVSSWVPRWGLREGETL